MTGKGILKGVFNIAATGLAVVLTPPVVLWFLFDKAASPFKDKTKAKLSEPLTQADIDLVESIFGKEVKTARVRKYFSPRYRPNNKAGVTGARKIIFYRGTADYSQSKSVFIHEMTHIWQFQRHKLMRMSYNYIRKNRGYVYELSAQSRFKDFGIEQQASIIEDYARQFLLEKPKGGIYDYLPSNYYRSSRDDRMRELPLLQKVVETRFPQACKTREALEAQQKTTPTARSQQISQPG